MKKEYKQLLICFACICLLVFVIMILVPTVLAGRYEISDYYPKTIDVQEKQIKIMITGKNLDNYVKINHKRIRKEQIVASTENWVEMTLDSTAYEQEKELNIYLQNPILLRGKSKKITIPCVKASETDYVQTTSGDAIVGEVGNDYKAYMISYLEKLAKTNYRVYLALGDESMKAMDEDVANAIKGLGAKINLNHKYRRSYAGVFLHGECLYEKMKKRQPVLYTDDDTGFEILSAAAYCGSFASIGYHGKEYGRNGRGVHIVVLDEQNKQIVDSVVFDTHENLKPFR